MQNTKPISDALEQAMENTLATAAKFELPEVIDYLTGTITAAVSLLRAADDGKFVYGFLKSALASLGKEAMTAPNPHGGPLGISAHMGASMANPEMLHTVEELRRELHSANDQLIERDIQLADQKAIMQRVFTDFGKVVLAHKDKDAVLLKSLLDEFCQKHVRFVPKNGTVH